MKNKSRRIADEWRGWKLAMLLAPFAFSCLHSRASSTGGSGGSTLACAGFPSVPCARYDVAQHSTSAFSALTATSSTGFIGSDPDYGARLARVTNANTEAASRGCCSGNSASEVTSWGLYDLSLFNGDGGYRFSVTDGDGAVLFFELDAKTMAVQQITSATNPNLLTGSGGGFTGLIKINGDWSSVSPTVIYAQGATGSTWTWTIKYDFSTDLFYDSTGNGHTTPVAFIDWSTCPNLPTPLNVGTYGTSFAARSNDTIFGAVVGGSSQGYTVFEMNAPKPSTSAGYTACYWYETDTGQWGGTGQTATTITGSNGQLLTPGTPSLSASAGGSVSYCAVVTSYAPIHNQSGVSEGDTLPSGETCTTGSSSATLTVTFAAGWSNPSQLVISGGSGAVCTSDTQTNCKPYRIWMASNSSGSASGQEVLQNSGNAVAGGTFTIGAASIVTGTASPPTQSTAGFNIHNGPLSTSAAVQIAGYQQGNGRFFWTPATGTVVVCGQNTGSSISGCGGGHFAPGYNMFANANGPTGFEVATRTYSNPGSPTVVQNPLGTGTASDSHVSWADSRSASGDSLPLEQIWVQDSGSVNGNGSLNLNTNPCTEINGTWNNEVDLVGAGVGAGRVWRFAHTRGTGCAQPSANAEASFGSEPIGNLSQDGRFALFHSVWGWQLGSAYESGWTASHSYSAKSIIEDSNGNYEFTTSGGTSGSTAPTWSTASGGTTTDSSVTWTMITGCTDPNNPNWGTGNAGLGCRTDVFVVELR